MKESKKRRKTLKNRKQQIKKMISKNADNTVNNENKRIKMKRTKRKRRPSSARRHWNTEETYRKQKKTIEQLKKIIGIHMVPDIMMQKQNEFIWFLT